MKRRTEKTRKRAAEKKARKTAAMRRPGTSKYAIKARQHANGSFSPRSPFHAVVTVVEDAA